MSHILKYTEWQSPTGKWHTNDISDLGNGSGFWWHVPRMLKMELTDYILFLKDKYNAVNFSYDVNKNVLLWDWEQKDCHQFTLYVNREAKKRQFFV